jgi:hypothetical protein
MKTLIQIKAEEYAKRIAEEQEGGYIFTDAEVLVEDAYKAGAEDEHRLLTEWHDAKEEVPEINVAVLVKSQYGKLGIGYYMGTNAWDAFGHRLASNVVTAWRPIHE